MNSTLTARHEGPPARTTIQTAPLSRKKLWTARIVAALCIVFLVWGGVIKLMKIDPVLEVFAELGFPVSTAVAIGLLEIGCALVFAIPRTAVLGAVLLTAYLGGAVVTHVRVGAGAFPIVFPIIIGALIWGSLFLRDDRLRALLPLRR